MGRYRHILPQACFCLLCAVGAQARTFLVDFNSSTGYRGVDPVSPDQKGNHWNAIPDPVTGQAQLNGLVDSDGQESLIDLGFSSPFGSDSYNGPAGDTTTGPPDFLLNPATVANVDIDAIALGDLGSKEAAFDFIATVHHAPAGQTGLVHDARFAIQGLDPQLTYTLKLFGSRKYSDDSVTIYEAFSDPAFEYLSASAALQVCRPAAPGQHNRDQMAVLSGIRPSVGGAIYVRVRGAQGNQGFLNALQIIEGTRPVDARGLLYLLMENPATGREIVRDPDRGLLCRADSPLTDLRGHWYLMTRSDNARVWILNRVTGEALRAPTDAGPVHGAPWDPDDARQTWRVETAGGVSRLRIEGTAATLTAGAEGASPTVAPDSPGLAAQGWILPELPRGGLFPWTTYDEDNFAVLTAPAEFIRSPYNEGSGPLAAEAQKRGLLLLNGFGTRVAWNAVAAADVMTLRYSVADGDRGVITLRITGNGGAVTTYKIPVTSAQAWLYLDSQGNEFQTAGAGRTPAKRFNEARIRLNAPLQPGHTIEFVREPGDVMTWIDLLEAETSQLVPMPGAAGFLSVANFGAVGNGVADDTLPMRNAVAAAAAQGKGLYLPPGAYRLESEIILPPGLVLQGAGLWHTELIFSRTAASPYTGQALGGLKGTGSDTKVRDLYLKSAQEARSLGYHALKGSWGTGSLIENVWADHFEAGAWITDFSNDPDLYTVGLVMRSCRFRNAFADGVNFAGGTRHAVVENCHVRGCGDDGLATYASGRALNKPTTRGNRFRYNTIECIYRAGGIGVFGGEGHGIHHNVIRDQVAGPGLRLNTLFVYLGGELEGYPFGSQLIHFFDNTLERTGSLTLFNERAGAIELQTWHTHVENIRFTDIDIDTTRYEGIRFSRVGQVTSAGFHNIVFTRIGFAQVPFGALITPEASGQASFDDAASAAGINNQSATFTVNGPLPPPPILASFTPSAAVRGSTVTVTGSFLGSAQVVEVGAQTAASFTVLNDGTLRFVVPPEAIDGRIRVTTAGGAATSAALLVVPQNNEPPAIALGLPGAVALPEGVGLQLTAIVTDDGWPEPPAAVTTFWSVVTAPAGGIASLDDPAQESTGATFGAPGTYRLRLTADDGELISAADVVVSVGPPAAGIGQDVGMVGVAGSSSENQGIWTVHGSGADIWDEQDGFRFHYVEWTGDGFLQARLLSQTDTDPWAKAGLMIRDNLTAGAAHAMLVGTPGNGLALQHRPASNELSLHESLGAYGYGVWLRIVRSGATVTAYRSANGTDWVQAGTVLSPAMTDPVCIGLAVTSHKNNALGSASFDHLLGSGFGAPLQGVSAGADVTAEAGATVHLAGTAAGSVAIQWLQISGPGTLVFGSPDALATTVSATGPGSYRVRLVIDDGAVRLFDEITVQFERTAAQAFLFDFGNNASYRGTNVVNPDRNGRFWNNVDSSRYWPGVVDMNGATTSVAFGFVTAAGTDSYNGPAGVHQDPALAHVDAAALGALGVNEAVYDYYVSSTFGLHGLDPAKTYDLTFFGSRIYTDDATTVYTVYTSNDFTVAVASAELNVRDPDSPWLHNSNTVVALRNVAPRPDGSLWVGFAGARGGDGYLNAMMIEGHAAGTGRVGVADIGWSAGTISLSFIGAAGVEYVLEHTADLTDPQGWRALSAGGLPVSGVGDGLSVIQLDDAAPADAMRAYRLVGGDLPPPTP